MQPMLRSAGKHSAKHEEHASDARDAKRGKTHVSQARIRFDFALNLDEKPC